MIGILKKRARIIVDFLMVVFFVALMLNQITGVLIHEIFGIGVFVLFLVHHLLNRNFYKTILKGKLTKLRTAILITDVLLFTMMILMVISSFLISQLVFSFLGITNQLVGRKLHILSAYSIYLLSAFHLGLHYQAIIKLPKGQVFLVYIAKKRDIAISFISNGGASQI